MPRLGRDAGDLISDRRQLIGFVLETYRRQGGRTVLPVGVSSDEDWLLDKLDVERLLKSLLKERRVELAKLTEQTGKTSGTDNQPSQFDPEASESLASHQHTKSLDSAWEYGVPPEAHAPQLNLPELKMDFAEYELQEIAFTLFALCCAKPSDTELVACMRRQLELSTARAEDISRMIKPLQNSLGPFAPRTPPGTPSKSMPEAAELSLNQDGPSTPAQQGSEPSTPTPEDGPSTPVNEPTNAEALGGLPGANLELILQLLKQVRPKDFRKFKDFVRWRCALADILVQNLKYAAATGWKGDAEGATAKSLVARLSGAVRRLSVADPEDYDEQEYSDAAGALVVAAEDLASLTMGGWQFSWGMRVKLWEALLATIFDDPEDGLYIGAKDKILKRLHSYLGPKLDISPLMHKACLVWVHFEQFTKTLAPDVMDKTQALLEELNDSEADEGGNELDLVYVQEIKRAVVDWVERTMMDYHLSLPEAENMEGLLRLLIAPASTKESKEHLIKQCISASCSKAVRRALEPLRDAESPMLMLNELSDSVGQLFEMELLKYTAHLAPFCSTAASVAAAQFHKSFGQELLPELHKLDTLPEDVVAMLHAVTALEETLLSHIDEGGSEKDPSPKPWNAMALIEPIIIKKVKQKLDQLGDFVGQLVMEETWEPVSEIEPVSCSAVDVEKALRDCTLSLFKLDLTFPAQAINKLLDGINHQLVAYAEATVKGLGDRSLLIPALPQKTRYKKDLATAAMNRETSAKLGTSTSFMSKVKAKIKEPVIVPVVRRTSECEDSARISSITLSDIMVRVNSLHFLKKSIPEFISMIDARAPPHEGDMPSPVHQALMATDARLSSSLHECCGYLGDKVVFWDMRHEWLESLYRHQVERDAIHPIVSTLDNKVMSSIAEGSLDKAMGYAAEGLMKSCVKCYERVLLDGGPYRLFDVGDVSMLESDVEQMKKLFLGDGEGIAKETVEAEFSDLRELLAIMGMSTKELTSCAEGAKSPGDGSKLAVRDNKDVLVKVLCHRRDWTASKWIKSKYKDENVPKKL